MNAYIIFSISNQEVGLKIKQASKQTSIENTKIAGFCGKTVLFLLQCCGYCLSHSTPNISSSKKNKELQMYVQDVP